MTSLIDCIAHRGPDDHGILVDGRCSLGFRRLSILDLSQAGHQPMTSRDGTLSMVFNGEIYNYVELRAELERSATVSCRRATSKCCSRRTRSGDAAASTGSWACTRSASSTDAPPRCSSRATGSASSRCTSSAIRAACCSPPSSRRSAAPASGTAASIRRASRNSSPSAVRRRCLTTPTPIWTVCSRSFQATPARSASTAHAPTSATGRRRTTRSRRAPTSYPASSRCSTTR